MSQTGEGGEKIKKTWDHLRSGGHPVLDNKLHYINKENIFQLFKQKQGINESINIPYFCTQKNTFLY